MTAKIDGHRFASSEEGEDTIVHAAFMSWYRNSGIHVVSKY